METENTTESPDETTYLSDELIIIIRNLLHLTMCTGANIIDSLRAVQVKVRNGKTIPTDEYVLAYNTEIKHLVAEAERLASIEEERLEAEATDEMHLPTNPTVN